MKLQIETVKKTHEALQESHGYIKNSQGLIGLHASFTVSEETLKQAALMMVEMNSGVHIHVAEDVYDQEECLKSYNTNVVLRLKRQVYWNQVNPF